MVDNPQPLAESKGSVLRPWWREGMVWLVIGGPAVVVVASIATAVVAYRGADEVLREPPAVQKVNVRPASDTPAVQARNHAATASQR